MNKLNKYEEIFVQQENRITGCIPASIEWMMRYKKITIPDDFQKKFDLEAQGMAENNYKTVSEFIMKDKNFSNIKFEFIKKFPSGEKKYEYVEDKITQQIPVCISYFEPLIGCFHSVPVVEIDARSVFILTLNGYNVDEQKNRFPRRGLIFAHENINGGQDTLALLD